MICRLFVNAPGCFSIIIARDDRAIARSISLGKMLASMPLAAIFAGSGLDGAR
jgi:hypothetical protein